jgi:hypothetical protein
LSEPQKQPEKKPILTKRVILFLVAVIVVGSSAYVILNVYDPLEVIEPAQQSPPNVIPEITNPIKSEKFNIADFDRCVKLLIEYVQTSPFPGDKLDSQDQIKLNDILSQYEGLNCPLVEDQLSQTPQYKNRNSLEP